MDNGIEEVSVLRFTAEGGQKFEDLVARELPLTINLNDQELVTLLCSPTDLKYLAVGFLVSEGLLESRDEIKNVLVDEKEGVARVETSGGEDFAVDVLLKRIISSGCGKGASLYGATDTSSRKVESHLEITADEIFSLVKQFQRGSQLYLTTHGVHSAALCDRENILVFSEDIGRHNAIDKIFGKCLLEGISTDSRIIITSGRITSEILHKVARRDIPIIVSISAPTDLGVSLAESLGITLVGLVRGKRMNVYTADWRILADEKQRCRTS